MNIKFLAAVLILASALVGCASAPTTTSSYLDNYVRLAPGGRLEAYWQDDRYVPRFDQLSVRFFSISTEIIANKKNVSVADVVAWLTEDLTASGIVAANSEVAALNLELAITFMDPGSAAARIWAGDLGAGHAQLQIEGKYLDSASGQLVATFAERRRSSGAIGLKDIGGDAGAALIREMVRFISEDIVGQLRKSFGSYSESDN